MVRGETRAHVPYNNNSFLIRYARPLGRHHPVCHRPISRELPERIIYESRLYDRPQ